MKKLNSDYFGIIGSVLCAVHCALTPFIIAAMSAAQIAEKGLVWLDYLFITLCLWAVFHSSQRANSPKIKIGFWASWVVFAMGILLEDAIEGMNYMGYAGTLGLVGLHFWNLLHLKYGEKGKHSDKK